MAKYVVFTVGNEEYGIGIHQVRSIETMQPITRVPTDNQYVKGVINLRGTVVPVLDLGKQLGLKDHEVTKDSRIIVLTHDDFEVGVIVDAAQNVMDIEDGVLQPPTDGAGKLLFVEALAKLDDRVLALLDLKGVLDPNSVSMEPVLEEVQ